MGAIKYIAWSRCVSVTTEEQSQFPAYFTLFPLQICAMYNAIAFQSRQSAGIISMEKPKQAESQICN